jgi:putative colanic acid biosynthesis acetyltransferase WcaF
MQTRLDRYNNSWYRPGGSLIRQILWYFVNQLVFRHGLLPLNFLKCFLLKLFGARIGKGVVIKPNVNIKYPWRLRIADYVWIGEEVWIDNLGNIELQSHVCLSQGCLLICGNHNFKKSTFDLMVGDITLEEGVWIGVRAIVGPGVRAGNHAVLEAGSVAGKNLDAMTIYRGNPAQPVKKRIIDGAA